jgi:hypothetical protein
LFFFGSNGVTLSRPMIVESRFVPVFVFAGDVCVFVALVVVPATFVESRNASESVAGLTVSTEGSPALSVFAVSGREQAARAMHAMSSTRFVICT